MTDEELRALLTAGPKVVLAASADVLALLDRAEAADRLRAAIVRWYRAHTEGTDDEEAAASVRALEAIAEGAAVLP